MPDLITRITAALAGRYAILRELGHGGMAVVYLADDTRHGRQVAVKAVRPEVLVALGHERFDREIAIAAQLSHSHIIPLFDSGTADGIVFFVMPYVQGESLRERLTRQQPLPVEEAVKVARDVASALAYAHAQGVIHRDIKPENILLEGGEARVADFGVARALAGANSDALTTGGLVVGTPAYMSPEQASGERAIDARSDLYALGCVLYEMLTGEPPFTGATAHAIMARQAYDTPTPVAVLRPDVPLALGELVHRMLKKLPVDRPAGATEVVRALQDASHATPPTLTPPPRRRSWAGLFALGGLVVGGIAVWSMLRADRVALNPNRIAVVQIATSADETDSLRTASITGALVSALNSSGVLSAVEVRVPPGGDPALAARAVGAGRWIEGTLFEGDSLRLTLAIQPATGDAPPVRPLVLPVGTEVWNVGFEAAGRLVGRLVTTARDLDRAPLSLLQGRSPAARTQFFMGEEAYRRASFADALVHFRAALAEDSTFTYAALRAAQAASWLKNSAAAAALIKATGSRLDSLPPKYAAFARGLRAFQAGQADSAVARFHEVLAIDPAAADGWMALGEVYAHLLPRVGSIDSLAEDAFRRVRILDSAFAPALPHLIEAALRRADTAAVALLSEFERGGPDTLELRRLQLAVLCALGGRKSVDWSVAAARNPESVFDAAQILAAGGLRQHTCAQAAANAVDAADPSGRSHFGTLVMRQGILVARGDTEGAQAIVEADTLLSLAVHRLLLTLDAVAGAPDTAAANQFVEGVRSLLAQRPDDVIDGSVWLAGVWLASRGQLSHAEAMYGVVLAKRGRGSSMARSLEGRLLLARGDTAAAIATLAETSPVAPKDLIPWTPWESLVADRILLAQLYLARNRPHEAIEEASVVDAPAVLTDIVFLPVSLAIRIEAADLVGDQQLARESRRRLETLHSVVQGKER